MLKLFVRKNRTTATTATATKYRVTFRSWYDSTEKVVVASSIGKAWESVNNNHSYWRVVNAEMVTE